MDPVAASRLEEDQRRRMPRQDRSQSKQDYMTPREFLDAVERRFGPLVLDLAADETTHVTPRWYGPGGVVPDALAVDWSRADMKPTGPLWLNPPFANIAPWAERCKIHGRRGATILFLTPASVSSEWFAQHVHGEALVLPIRPRLKFGGMGESYPKDLMLSVFGPYVAPGFKLWKWTEER